MPARFYLAVRNVVGAPWSLDGAFHDAYGADPQKALASTGLDVDPKAADLLPVFYEIMRWGFKHEKEVCGGSVG